MERDARYALVGLVSALLLVAGVAIAMGLAHFRVGRGYDLYDVDFEGPIRGLSAGGEVVFNGVTVGQVISLHLDPRDDAHVLARIRIVSEAPVRTDSGATLEPMGVTGVNYVQLTAGSRDRPLLKTVAPQRAPPVIHASRSHLDRVLQDGEAVLSRSVGTLDRLNSLLSARNVAAISATLEDVEVVSGRLRGQQTLLADLDQTLRSTRAASRRIEDLAVRSRSLIEGPGMSTLSDLSRAAVEIRSTAIDLRATVSQLAPPAQAFAAHDLPQLARGVATLQDAAASLDRIVHAVEQDPRGFVTRRPAREIEVQP